MDKATKNILIIGGVVLGSVLAYKLYKSHKDKSGKYSNLVDDMLANFGKPISQFTITNTTSSQQNVTLFDAYNNTSYPYSSAMSPVQINPSMSFFNQTLLTEPKKIKSIKIMANGGAGQIQATQPLTVTCKDANGDMASQTYIPMVSSTQYQGGITEVKPRNLILNGECVVNYSVQPNTTVTLILDYEQKNRKKSFFDNV